MHLPRALVCQGESQLRRKVHACQRQAAGGSGFLPSLLEAVGCLLAMTTGSRAASAPSCAQYWQRWRLGRHAADHHRPLDLRQRHSGGALKCCCAAWHCYCLRTLQGKVLQIHQHCRHHPLPWENRSSGHGLEAATQGRRLVLPLWLRPAAAARLRLVATEGCQRRQHLHVCRESQHEGCPADGALQAAVAGGHVAVKRALPRDGGAEAKHVEAILARRR